MAAIEAGLRWLAQADATSLAADAQAECLRALERAESVQTAARSRILAAFTAQGTFELDGHGTTRTWLTWQTRITRGAAAGAVSWMRRLAAHKAIAQALTDAAISASWARCVCDWTDRLPPDRRDDADTILLAAAKGGADLADLAGLAEEMYRRCAPADEDGKDGFTERRLNLSRHFLGAGKLDGDLTPECTAALQAVLDALGKKAGPEDDRSKAQRHHDALEEACRRLIASGCLPGRAGQPTQIQLHMSLEQVRGESGAAAAEAEWAGYGAKAGPGADCDASVAPVVTGHVDEQLLDRLTQILLGQTGADVTGPGPTDPDTTDPDTADPDTADPGTAGIGPDTTGPDTTNSGPAEPGTAGTGTAGTGTAGTGTAGTGTAGTGGAASLGEARACRAARDLIVGRAADLLSGPAGLAAFLRTSLLSGPAASASLPLDVGTATETIPPHLRRAVILRDQHCGFPGCAEPPEVCQVHHVIPRSQGGPTSLTNLHLQCSFHHLIVIHRWGWKVTLHRDGTVTAVSPDGSRVLRSHSPPAAAA